MTLTTPIRGLSIIPLDIFYLHTKFGNSRFSSPRDTIVGTENENRSCYPAVVCHL